jgi:hypothetical protein
VTNRSKSLRVRSSITKFALAGALIAVPTAALSVPEYATPGGTPNTPAAHTDALPAPPPLDTPSPAPPPPPPAPPQYNNSNDYYYYCGGCDGGGGGG